MKCFSPAQRLSALSDLNSLALSLQFLNGRTEGYEGNTVVVSRDANSLTVCIGEHEKLALTFHSQDNSWTISRIPGNPWEDQVMVTSEIASQARHSFIKGVVHSLSACKQHDGTPMLSQSEGNALLDGINITASQAIIRVARQRLDLFSLFRKSV